MKIELMDISWLKNMIAKIIGKDVEYNDKRGPISDLRIDASVITIDLSWQAAYHNEGWVKRNDQSTIQFHNPKIELLDRKMIRIISASEYCIIFFGYDSIVPLIPANN